MSDASAVVEVPTRTAMHDLGRRLAGLVHAGDLIVLTGDLGSGKTTLTQGIGDGLGVRGPITSPTFVIARVHPSLVAGPPLVHVDAYRLSSLAEVDDLDLDASLDEAVTVVEWGHGLVDGLTGDRVEVTLVRPDAAAVPLGDDPDGDAADDDPDETRMVTVTTTGDRWAAVDLDALLA